MEQSPSCEANGSSASEEFPRILRYPKVREPYSQHPSSCPYPEPHESNQRPRILLLEDSVSYYLPIYVLVLKKWHRTFRFPQQNSVWTSSSACHISSPSSLILSSSCVAPQAASVLRFLGHTHTHRHSLGLLSMSDQLVAEATTYTKHNKHKRRTSMQSLGLEPTIPATERLQTCALDRA